MSTTAAPQAPAATLPDPKQAFDHIVDNVHARAFYGTLAQRGYSPKTTKEAEDLMILSGKLRTVAQEKTASASSFAAASSDLDKVLAARGLDGGLKQASEREREQGIFAAAQECANDPAIYNSVLSLKAAEAAQVAAELGYQPTA